MNSKNGRPELVSLLQYMKQTDIENPEILVRDSRIVKLDLIVGEVKQTDEWEAVKMNILELGIQKGQEIGQAYAIIEILKELGDVPQEIQDRINKEQNLDILGTWLKLAIKATSIEEFREKSLLLHPLDKREL